MNIINIEKEILEKIIEIARNNKEINTADLLAIAGIKSQEKKKKVRKVRSYDSTSKGSYTDAEKLEFRRLMDLVDRPREIGERTMRSLMKKMNRSRSGIYNQLLIAEKERNKEVNINRLKLNNKQGEIFND